LCELNSFNRLKERFWKYNTLPPERMAG
jgi:hypothetical protein